MTAEELIQLIESDPELKRALQDRLVDAEAIQRALQDPTKRDTIRRIVLGNEWADAPALLRELIQAQRELTAQISALVEAQQRHEAILQEHAEILRHHTTSLTHLHERQTQLETELRELRDQLSGYIGRWEGEAHERRTIRRALSIFAGGSGGSPEQPEVRQRLRTWLRPFREGTRLLDPENDPTLADIIWWKGDTVIVGEVSIKVDRLDVLRARRRAQSLREVGINAIPVVIGEDWAVQETYELAQLEGVEWFVRGNMSPKLVEFRKLPDGEAEE